MEMASKLEQTIAQIRAHKYYKTIRNLSILFLYVVIGCAVYGELEGWNVATTLSFIVVTVTTVGYGYHTPGDDNSRLFTIFYIIFGLCFVFAMVMGFLEKQLSILSNALAKNLVQTSAEAIGADYQKNRRMVIYNLVAIAFTVLFGGIVLMFMEDWSFIQGVYFALCTSSTIGYGDLDLKEGYTHLFMAFYILFSTALFALTVRNITLLHQKAKQIRKLDRMMCQRQNLGFLEALDSGEGLSREQFVLALLVHFGTLDVQMDIQPWAEKFDALDTQRKGRVFRKDLVEFSTVEARSAAQEHNQLEAQTQPEGVLSVLRASLSFNLPPPSPSGRSPRAGTGAVGYEIDPELGESQQRVSEMSIISPMFNPASGTDDRKQPLL
eukprot:gene25027-30231_t